MYKSIEKVCTFFVVIILILLLLNWLGPFIADSIQPAGYSVSEILHNMWTGMQNITHTGSHHY
jgi:hypothetical protein